MSCIVTEGGVSYKFDNNFITVTGLPLDCSSSLIIDSSFVDPPPIPFNYAGSGVPVVTSYIDIF